MVEQVVVVGTGTWGTTLAVMLAQKGEETTLWCRSPGEAGQLDRDRQSARLPGLRFPRQLIVSSSLQSSLRSCTALLLAVPAQTMRENARLIRGRLPIGARILSCSKGIELATGKRMTEVIGEEIPEAKDKIAALSGPNLAKEVAAGLPATSVVAGRDGKVCAAMRDLLRTPRFRVYTNQDVIGVELAGALKNIIAIGAGFCDGLALGDNAKAAVIARGLLEITRLGVAAGANPLTFAGLAGLGDVIATCASPLSRNRHVGEQLAKGRPLEEIRGDLRMVAEGVATTAAALHLARQLNVDMPIVEMTHAVLFSGKQPSNAIAELMTRDPKDEFAGLVVQSTADSLDEHGYPNSWHARGKEPSSSH